MSVPIKSVLASVQAVSGRFPTIFSKNPFFIGRGNAYGCRGLSVIFLIKILSVQETNKEEDFMKRSKSRKQRFTASLLGILLGVLSVVPTCIQAEPQEISLEKTAAWESTEDYQAVIRLKIGRAHV